MRKSSLVKRSPSVTRSSCGVCSEHLEAFGVFWFWYVVLSTQMFLIIESWSCHSRVRDYNSRLSHPCPNGILKILLHLGRERLTLLASEIGSLFDTLLSWFPVAAVLSMSSFCVWFSNVVLGDVCLVTFTCISSCTPICQFMKIQRYQMSRIF